MANVVKTEWFGKQISVLMINGKSFTGELSEVTDNYIVLTQDEMQTQIMVRAIIAIRPAAQPGMQEQ